MKKFIFFSLMFGGVSGGFIKNLYTSNSIKEIKRCSIKEYQKEVVEKDYQVYKEKIRDMEKYLILK